MLYAIAALLVLIADQGLKYYVTLNIPLGGGVVTLIPGVMSLVNYHNTGAAFSMLSDAGARWAFVVLALAFSGAVGYLIINRLIRSKPLRWTLVLIAAGAMGNAIDRALYGYVVDMFRTDFMDFAIFNVADIFITLGGVVLCILILLMPSEQGKKDRPFRRKDETGTKPMKPAGIKLFSEKPKLTEETQTRRRTGKLYGEKKPYDKENPFAEFEQMPTSFESPKAPEPTPEELLQNLKEEQAAERLANQIQAELSLEAILNEYVDGTD